MAFNFQGGSGVLCRPAAARRRAWPLDARLFITSGCNLCCGYCSGRNGGFPSGPDLSFAAWEGIFGELAAMKVLKVQFTGGEPFIRPDFFDMCRLAADSRMRFGIVSNGTLIDEKAADFLRAGSRCDWVRISLDGPPAVNDAGRGSGGPEAERGIRNLLERGVTVQVRITIGSRNAGHLRETLEYLHGLGVKNVSVGFVHSLPGYPGSFASEIAGNALKAAVISEHRALPEHLWRMLTPECEALNLWRNWLGFLRDPGKYPPSGDNEVAVDCVYSTRSMVIAADGAVIPCPNLTGEIIGYAGRGSLSELWRGAMAGLRTRACPVPEKCRACGFRAVCRIRCYGPPHCCPAEILPHLPDFANWPLPEELFG